MRFEAEPLHELEVLAAVHACGGEHVVGDGCVCATLEGAFAVVAKNAASPCEADKCLRVDEPVNRHDAAEFVVREFREVLVRRAWDGVQNVHRCRLDAELAEVEAHVDTVFHGLAESHDAAAADFKTSGKSVLQGSNLVVVGVRGAYVGEVPAVSLQVVMEAGEAGFFQLVELFLVQESRRKAYGKFCLFFQAADSFANLFHVAVRKRTARGDDGVARNACGFFLLCVFDNFVGAEELVFGGASVVVAALGAVLAVFGATSAACIHDRAKVKIVAVEFFANFVGCFRKFVEVGIEQFHGFFAGNLVTA